MAKRRARLTDENDPLTSTDSVLNSYEQVSKSASQEADINLKQAQQGDKALGDNITSQQVGKSKLRKSTFQISQSVLQQLDTLHLQLQLELGKSNAPYKEVIVEEAIERLLKHMAQEKSELLISMQERQRQRL